MTSRFFIKVFLLKPNLSKAPEYIKFSIRIPTINIRSLNLSNCVAIIAHNYSMQNDYDGLDIEETIKKIY